MSEDCSCEFVDIGVGWQRVTNEPDCPAHSQGFYEEALRRYWRANTPPLAIDGHAYRRRCLARRRRRG